MKIENTSIRLKKIMDERRLKQVDILEMAKPFCKKFGVKLNKNDLSQYVSGKVEPGQNKLFILGLTLDVSEAWLMGYDVPMSRNQVPTQSSVLDKYTSPDDPKTRKAHILNDGPGGREIIDMTDEEYEVVKQLLRAIRKNNKDNV